MQINLRARIDFKPEKILKAVNRAKQKVLRRQGAYVRGIAKRKIKRRKNPDKHSLPGTAPYTHTGKLKNSIWYSAEKEQAVIGPTRSGIGNVGALHEFGGMHRVRFSTPFKSSYNIGDVGPVSITRYKRSFRSQKRGYYDTDNSPVALVAIKSKRQASHATRLAKRLNRKYGTKMVRYQARPFMRPSFNEAKGSLADFWRNAIK